MKCRRKEWRWFALLVLLLPLSGWSLNLFEYRNAQELPANGLPVEFYSNITQESQEFLPFPVKEHGIFPPRFLTLKVAFSAVSALH